MIKAYGAQRKFTFDTEFLGKEDRQAPAARARQMQTLTTEELDNLKLLARLEGENNAQVQSAQALERAIAALATALDTALAASAEEVGHLRQEAAELALAFASKLAPAALAALPAADVEHALRQAIHQAIAEPRIMLRAAPAAVQAVESRLAEITRQEGYDGRVLIVADPAVNAGDCRIEWRGGGVERSRQGIEDALAALIAQHFTTSLKG